MRILNLLNQTVAVMRNPDVLPNDDFARTFFLKCAGYEPKYAPFIIDVNAAAAVSKTYSSRTEFAENVIVLALFDNGPSTQLPPPETDVMFIVSEEIARNATERDDLLFPHELLPPDPAGKNKLVTFKMLACYKHHQYNPAIDD
jgi:hypothetical protein